MCLIANKPATRKIRKLLEESPTKSLEFYKYVIVADNELRGYFRFAFIYKPGENVSDRVNQHNNVVDDWSEYYENNRYEKGIHVYVCAPPIINNPHILIVKFTCHLDDFVAANDQEAVFMKAYLSQESYDRAIKV